MAIKNDVYRVDAKSNEPLFSAEDLKRAAVATATLLAPSIPLVHAVKGAVKYVSMSECEKELWKERAKELVAPLSSKSGMNGFFLATTVKDIDSIQSSWVKTCSDDK